MNKDSLNLRSSLVRIAGAISTGVFLIVGCHQNFTFKELSQAMEPTIPQNSIVSVDPRAYLINTPDRWELVVFRYPLATNSLFAMRVVGLAGESIMIKDAGLFVNGKPLEVPSELDNIVFAIHSKQQYAKRASFDIPSRHVFVLGDNSAIANDSRFWGPLNEDFIIGRITTITKAPHRRQTRSASSQSDLDCAKRNP